MAKKINFSIKNEDLLELENLSKLRGKKVVELIRERYEEGKKKEEIEQKFDKIISAISKNNEEQSILFFKMVSAIEILIKQTTFSNEVLGSILKGNLKDEDKLKSFYDLIAQKSDENVRKIKNLFFGN